MELQREFFERRESLKRLGLHLGMFQLQNEVRLRNVLDALSEHSQRLLAKYPQPVSTNETNQAVFRAAPGLLLHGEDNAKVLITVWTDYECPYCRALDKILAKIILDPRFNSKVAIQIKPFPLTIHGGAFSASMAAECGAQQGHFPAVHRYLMNEPPTELLHPEKIPSRIGGIDAAVFNSCLNTREVADSVLAAADDGNRLGVDSTPTIFIGAQKFQGNLTYDPLVEVLLQRLNNL